MRQTTLAWVINLMRPLYRVCLYVFSIIYTKWFLDLRPDIRLDRVCSKISCRYQLLNFLLFLFLFLLFIKPKPHYQLLTLTEYDLFTEINITELERFPHNICNGCGMPAGDADSSGHLVLSHFGTCMCSNVETNLSWTCLVSGLLNFEHPSVLLFCFKYNFSRRHIFAFSNHSRK